MKQVKFLAVAIGFIIATGLSANAQKMGSVNVDALVANLPEAAKAQEIMQKWQVDSIGGAYQKLVKDYQEKDSVLKKTTVKSVKDVLERDLAELGNALQNWQQITSPAIQAKQEQVFGPLYKKVMDAVNAYAKEKGYNYILTQEAFVVIPEADNISIPVAQRLGIKVDAKGNAAPASGAKPPTSR